MKSILVILTFLVTTSAFAQGTRENITRGQDGNGGAGVSQKGRYMTFYTAGLYVEKVAQPVPGLDALTDFLLSMNYISGKTQGDLMAVVTANENRQYLKVTQFDDVVKARLLAEFQRVTTIKSSELELFAVTDTNTKTTFLLPAFYELSLQDQMTILFHENYWLVRPKATYAEVVKAEVSFQALLNQPTSTERQMDFADKAGGEGDSLKLAINQDFASGAIRSLVSRDDGSLSPETLFGPEFMACGGTADCFNQALPHLYALSKKMPNSFLLKRIIRRIGANRIIIDGYHEEKCKKPGSWSSSDRNRISGFGEAKCMISTQRVTMDNAGGGWLAMTCEPRQPKAYCQESITGTRIKF